MSLSSPSDRKVPKSLAFIALLGLLLIAAVAFVPNSSAGLPAFQNGSRSESKRSRPESVPGEALVRFKSDRAFEGSTYMPVPNEVVQQKISGIQGTAAQEQILVQVDRFGGSDLVDGLRIAHAADTGKAIAALRARDDVEYAEPNYIVYAINTPNDPCFPANSLAVCQSTSLYGMTNIGATQAWNIPVTGSSNVVVGVIDEGIDISHPDLAANIWTNPVPGGGSIAGISGDVHGYDFINNSGTIPPEQHATHVAGTIGAVGNNGVGVVGVNWQVKLMSLRFIDQATNNGSTADAIRAYNYAKQMRDLFVSSSGASGANIRALNASYGGGGFSKAEQDALTALGNSGILFAAAAGNDGRNTDTVPNYPSGYNLTNMISVAATTQPDTLAGFSNFGVKSVLMGAPGVGILSTTPANTYSVFSGTSMATPHVAGAAALVCAAAAAAVPSRDLSVNQLHALLAFNGDVVPALQGTTLTGRRLNVFKSIQALNEGDTTPPGTVGNFRVTSQTGRAVNLAWTASGDDGPAGQASLYDISFTDQFTGAVIPLTTIAPVTSGSPQTVTVNIPYRHTAGFIKLREFDNVGNEGTATTFPVTVDRLVADPYATSLSSPAALSTGGTPLGLTFDDRYRENYPLGLSFPFFGQTFTTVTISTNGNLYFSPPRKRSNGDADDVPSSIGDLSTFKMIAGMWDDLDLRTSRRADADVYVVTPDASRIIFRWQGVQFGDGTNGAPINFEIELNVDGTIKTRYGSDNTNLLPVVGISGGEPDVYVADALTSELSPISLTNAPGAVFTPRALVPLPAVQFSSSTYSVTKGDPNNPRVNITVTRAGDPTSSASVGFATIDDAGLQNCNVFNGTASPRCDYENTIGTLNFAAGETSKSFSVAIVADSYAKGNLTFRVALSNPSGATMGSTSIATVTILDNPSVDGPNNPIDNTNFFVRQQYLDFLGREPDPPGFAGWTATINNCSGDTTQCDRIHVSQLFFQSAEFQDRGYFVYRFYPVAFGRKPDYAEFVPDLSSVSGFLDANQLEAAKVAFIAGFMARTAFVNTYNSLTNQQYVDALLNTAGVTLSSRQVMIDGLNNSTMTRGQVLRQIVESPEVSTKYNHQAYAVMEYFGYLRRQPDAFYLQWIAVLDATNDPRGMVTGFATSQEYRNRFGP